MKVSIQEQGGKYILRVGGSDTGINSETKTLVASLIPGIGPGPTPLLLIKDGDNYV